MQQDGKVVQTMRAPINIGKYTLFYMFVQNRASPTSYTLVAIAP